MKTPATMGEPVIDKESPNQTPVTPVGNPVKVAPVAPTLLYEILVIAVLIHLVCAFVPAAEVNVIVLFAVTEIVPVAVTGPHPPVSVTV